MPDQITVEVRGLAQLGRALQSIPAVLATRVMREALHAAGDVMAAAAEATAPVLSGELKSDIIVKVHVSGGLDSNYVLVGPGYDRGSLRVRGVRRNRRGALEADVDTTDSPGIYGGFVEEGHAIEFGNGEVPPHPWLRPAFEASKEEAVEVFATYVRAGLEAIAAAVNAGEGG